MEGGKREHGSSAVTVKRDKHEYRSSSVTMKGNTCKY